MKAPNTASFGARLSWLMHDQQLRNADVARLAGVHPITVSKWRNGAYLPEEAQMQQLATALQISAQWLRYGDDVPPSVLRPALNPASRQAVAARLLDARELAGVTREQAAAAFGISVRDVARIEIGDLDPGGYFLFDAAELYNVEPEWLAHGKRRNSLFADVRAQGFSRSAFIALQQYLFGLVQLDVPVSNVEHIRAVLNARVMEGALRLYEPDFKKPTRERVDWFVDQVVDALRRLDEGTKPGIAALKMATTLPGRAVMEDLAALVRSEIAHKLHADASAATAKPVAKGAPRPRRGR